jgi:hypothetical protein
MSWLKSDRLSAWLPPSTMPMPPPSAMNGSACPAGNTYAMTMITVHSTRLSSTVFHAPIRLARAPMPSAPKNARNCTIRMVGTSTSSESPSSSVPYTLASAMTVWMPSL